MVRGTKKFDFLKSCLLELKSWLYDLPLELRIDKPNQQPHAYTLHMVYHTSLILLTKFFQTSRNTQVTVEISRLGDVKDVERETFQLARYVYRQAAQDICVVAQKYREVYGSFHSSVLSATHCTLSVALVFIDEARQDSTTTFTHISRTKGIETCLTVLEELSYSWNPAMRIHKNLVTLCRKPDDSKQGLQERKLRSDHIGSAFSDILDDGSPEPNSVDPALLLLDDVAWLDGLVEAVGADEEHCPVSNSASYDISPCFTTPQGS